MNNIRYLKEVSEVITKGTTPTTVGGVFTDEGINFVKSESICDSKYLDSSVFMKIDEETDEKLKRSRLQEGDLLFSIAGAYLGKISIVRAEDLPANTNQAVGIVRLKNELVDVSYLYYFFSQTQINSYINKLSAQSSQPNLNLDLLGRLSFNCLALDEQKKISSILSAIDAKIELNNRINAELEALAKTLYDYWFVQFDFPFDFASCPEQGRREGKPTANGKPYKSSGGKMVYNPILKREIPEGWEVAVVAEILGKTPASNKVLNQEILADGSIPVIDQSQDYICGFTDDITALITPTQPHVVFGDHTRVVKLVNFEYARGADGTQILLSNDARMPGYLLYQVVSDIDLSNYGYARHFKFLKDYKIILPNQTIAARYHEVVAPCYEKIKGGIFENQHLMRLRDWLLPMLMNGQVTVK
ncbi:restriction endonuclease subunit S [Methylotuvimicrobium sp. KM2]|uniref:restriction endonuclease subunit S n=1 Tax=Methylotuvimicrobium sp. KM2 TaxID=3133976 RepID=UPI003101ACD2